MKPFGNAIFPPMVAFILALTFLYETLPAKNNTKIRDTLTVIYSRKSVRKYLDKPVTKEQLMVLMKAGMAAPTAADKRPWAYLWRPPTCSARLTLRQFPLCEDAEEGSGGHNCLL